MIRPKEFVRAFCYSGLKHCIRLRESIDEIDKLVLSKLKSVRLLAKSNVFWYISSLPCKFEPVCVSTMSDFFGHPKNVSSAMRSNTDMPETGFLILAVGICQR